VTSDGKTLVEDGVAVLYRGDTVLIVYQAAARLHRTKWLFRSINELAAHRAGDFMAFMVVLPTADPPDAATRAENSAQLRKLGTRLRRLVTAPVGDAFRMSIVRTVMRALAALQGKSGVHFVSNTIEEGLRRIREAAGAETPSVEQLRADLRALHEALGVPLAR
jgi:hypothetical protein